MAIVVACTCGKRFSAKDEHGGKLAKCPACGRALVIPNPGAKATSQQSARKTSEGRPCVICGEQVPADEVARGQERILCKGCLPAGTRHDGRGDGASTRSAHGEAPHVTKSARYSAPGIIVAAIFITCGSWSLNTETFVGTYYTIRGSYTAVTFESRAPHSMALGLLAGGFLLLFRSFLPRLTLPRGFLILWGGLLLPFCLHFVISWATGVIRPSWDVRVPTVMGVFVAGPMWLLVGFNTSQTGAERRRSKSQLAVSEARRSGRPASLCEVCGGTGRRGYILEWRCGACRGQGYGHSPAEVKTAASEQA